MAARKSTASRTDPGRDRRGVPASLADAVDDERMRLMKLHSLLQCIEVALECLGPAEPLGASGPYFPDVVNLASELARESINRLESVTELAARGTDRTGRTVGRASHGRRT